MSPKRRFRQEIADLIAQFEEAGWRVDTDRGGYPRAFCPCGQHQRSIHLTPSNPHYAKNALRWLQNQPCYQEGRR